MSKKPLLLILSAVVTIVSGCGGGSSTTTETHNTPQALVISTTSLPNGNVQYSYRATLATTGGTQPVSWTVINGALPGGVSLAETGLILGTPTTAGIYNFTIKAMDSASPAQSTTAPLSITINEPPPRITSLSLPVGAINSAYGATLQSIWGKSPVTWRVAAGTLPFGLTLNATTGQISGMATTAGTFNVTVQVADSTIPPQTDSQPLNITINPPLSIATTALPNSAVSCRYAARLESSGGTPSATWSIIAGALPAGLLLNSATGWISGTPTTAGTVSFTAQAQDSSVPVQLASENLSLTIAATPQGGCWRDTGSMLAERGGHTATLLQDGKVLIVSEMTAELYSAFDGSWMPTGGTHLSRFGHTATLLNNGRVLVAGGDDFGFSEGFSAELYDPGTGTWIITGGMSVARRGGHSATLLLDGKVLVVGGATDPTAELYNPAVGTWSRTGNMAAGRSGQTATRLNDGSVLVAGGSSGGTVLATAELYDPATGTWASTGSMAIARTAHTATLLKNGQVLVVGGNNGAGASETAELYDPATRIWAPAASMKAGRYYHTATLLNDGQVLVAGGSNGDAIGGYCCSVTTLVGDPIATAEIYDPVARTWTTTLNNMRADRFGHTATLLNDGKVLAAGGVSGWGPECDDLFGCHPPFDVPVFTSSAEIYDPGP